MSQHGRIRIGTSGWSYDHWDGPFYPDGLAADDRLAFYADRFDTVEINNSFYQLPDADRLGAWQRVAGRQFVFAAKASRYITHMKKLKDPEASLQRFMARIETLGENLGPILFQLPPRWNCNHRRLKSFLAALPDTHLYTFEFRDRSWLNTQTLALLREHGAAFCIYELAGFTSPKETTAEFVYIRLHGPGAAYEGSYDGQALAGWAGAISAWQARGLDVYCYFDNDQAAHAPLDARRLKEMLDA